jgi:hypothetical protein
MSTGPERRRRSGVAAAATLVALAALAALLSAYSPSLDAPGLHARKLGVGAAHTQLLIDTPHSVLLDGTAASRYDIEEASNVARSYIVYLHSYGVAAELGRSAGLHGGSVSVAGPFTLLLNLRNFAPEGPSLPEPRTVSGTYRVLLDVDGHNPILNIYTQTPNARSAIALAEATRTLLLGRVAAMHAADPGRAGREVVLRPLGPAVGGEIGGGADWQLMIFVFALVLALGASLMCARSRRPARRRAEQDAAERLDRLDRPARTLDEWPHTKRVLPWALAVFVGMLFLVPFDAIKLPLHLPLDSTLDRPMVVALVLLWVSSLAVLSGNARPRVKLTRVHAALIGFFAICCLSLAFNGHALTDMSEVSLVVKKLALLASFIVFFFVAASVLRPREVPKFIALMVGLGVIVAIGTVVEYRFQFNPFYEFWGKIFSVQSPGTLDVHDEIGRLTVFGPTSEPLELAAMLAMVVPFALIGTIDAPTRKGRILYMVAMALLIAGGLATSRKTSVVAPAAAMLLLAVYRPRVVGRALLGFGLVLAVLVHFTSPGAIGKVLTQFEPSKLSGSLTTTERTARYDAVRPDVVSHVLLGRGYESYDPHKYRILDSEYLGILIGVGVIGLLGYLAIFGAMMSAAQRTIRGPDPRRASAALAAFASVGVIAVASALFDVLSFPHVPYLLFFVAAMIVVLREPSPRLEPARRIALRPWPDDDPDGLMLAPPVLPPEPVREPVLAG